MEKKSKISLSSKIIPGLLLIALFLAFIFDLFIGSVRIPVSDIFKIIFTNVSEKEEWRIIILDFRIPKAITALLVGVALSVSGLLMQTVFRNPLAGPYVLGISAGASLGVAVLVLGMSSFFAISQFGILSNWAIAISAWIGSGLILLLILFVSVRVRDIITILILGIMFASATTAIVSILQYFSDKSALKAFIVWTMGSLSNVSTSQLNVLIPCVVIGTMLALFATKMLNALLLGENYARSLGLNIKLVRFLVFFCTSLLAGSVTAFCGPIGFVGIAVPHVARMLLKTSNHKLLLPSTIIIGGLAMLISDIVSQLPGYDSVLPINSVTAMLGVPIVIWIIIKNRKVSNYS